MPTPQEEFWKGDFGTAYVSRNRLDFSRRVPFWTYVLEKTQAKSILEVGCNIGTNLKALRFVDRNLRLAGVEINHAALQEAADAGLEVYDCPAQEVGKAFPGQFDLVFTAGVLIHVGTDDLSEVMDNIIAASKKYVLAVEYPAASEQEITYRGHAERLWKRPFGKLYQAKGLKTVETSDAGDGFDACTSWLLQKGDA